MTSRGATVSSVITATPARAALVQGSGSQARTSGLVCEASESQQQPIRREALMEKPLGTFFFQLHGSACVRAAPPVSLALPKNEAMRPLPGGPR